MKFKSDTRHFGDMVRYCGTILDRILIRLDELGIAEETLVLFTCDNGTGREIVSWMGDRLVLGRLGRTATSGHGNGFASAKEATARARRDAGLGVR